MKKSPHVSYVHLILNEVSAEKWTASAEIWLQFLDDNVLDKNQQKQNNVAINAPCQINKCCCNLYLLQPFPWQQKVGLLYAFIFPAPDPILPQQAASPLSPPGLLWLSATLQIGCAVPMSLEGLVSGVSGPGGQGDTHTSKSRSAGPRTRQRKAHCSAPFS